MHLSEILRPEDLVVPLEAVDKWDAIARLVAHLVACGRIPEDASDELLELVMARERSMSTGMEQGIAIPHAAVDVLDELVGCMGVVQAEEGLAFEAIDARPTYLVVLLLIPRAQKLLHIRTLADVARVLRRDSVRDALINSGDVQTAWGVLSAADEGS